MLPFNHPIRTAERVETLDILSHGRFELGTARGQARVAFDNLSLTLRVLNAQWSSVCSLRMYVVGQQNLPAVRDDYREWAPASTLVFVQALFRPEVLVEVEAVVAFDRRSGVAAVRSSEF